MKNVTIGKYVVPTWVLGVALTGICVGAFALYTVLTFTIPVEVRDPIEVLYYPSRLSLYPGDTIYFNVTVMNHASHDYTVFLDFSLDNSTYEANYVTFSSEIYLVHPGLQTLTAWIKVSETAPAINAVLTVNLLRTSSWSFPTEQITFTDVEFLGSGTTIRVTLKNTGTVSVTLVAAHVDGISRNTNPTLPQTIPPSGWLTLDIESPWYPGVVYLIWLITSRGSLFQYTAIAESYQEESLHLSKQHVWYNTSGEWAEAALVIINTGGRNVVIDDIVVRGQQCPWSNVYYWRTNDITISDDLQVTSTPITGDTFNITVQGTERVFQQATNDLTLEVGWTVVIYIMNPDSIHSNDIGVTVGITVFTINAQYYIEANVEPAE